MPHHSSDATHGSQHAPTSGVEEDHVDIRAVFGFGIGLAVVAIVVHILMLWMYSVEVAHVDATNPPRVFPLAAENQEDRRPPTPRLQDGVETSGPKQALQDMHAEEDARLNGYMWVDRNASVVRIPVAEAMKLTLQRGLPSRAPQTNGNAPAAAAAPTATQEKK
jgi:hypothetical protein